MKKIATGGLHIQNIMLFQNYHLTVSMDDKCQLFQSGYWLWASTKWVPFKSQVFGVLVFFSVGKENVLGAEESYSLTCENKAAS